MIFPAPWQASQVAVVWKDIPPMRCTRLTCPEPPQAVQTCGVSPFAAPVPRQSRAVAHAAVGNVLLYAERRFLECNRHAQGNVLTLHRSVAPARRPTAPERTAEHSAQNVAEVEVLEPAKTAESAVAAAHRGVKRRVTVLVVLRALVRVGKNGIRLVRFLEFLLSRLVSRIRIGVVLLRQLIVCFLDRSRVGVLVNAQNLIVISFLCHPIDSL